jgi:hypothetical protein
VRAASSQKLWRHLIKDPAFLDGLRSRYDDHGFTSSLLLGFFYQEDSEAPSHLWQHHEDKSRCLAPSFVPASELVPFGGATTKEGCNVGTFLGASLNFYQPVASQDSFLALRLRPSPDEEEGREMPDVLRVCNPLTGQVFSIPNSQVEPPLHYVLLVNDDVGATCRPNPSGWSPFGSKEGSSYASTTLFK